VELAPHAPALRALRRAHGGRLPASELIAIALVVLARIAIVKPDDLASTWQRDVGFGLGLAAVTFGLVRIGGLTASNPKTSVIWIYVLPVLVAFAWSRRPIRYAGALGGILLVSTLQGGLTGNTLHAERDFFGTLKVRRDPTGREGAGDERAHPGVFRRVEEDHHPGGNGVGESELGARDTAPGEGGAAHPGGDADGKSGGRPLSPLHI